MKFRAVHNGTSIITVVEHTINTVTSTPDENNFMIETMPNLIRSLAADGIDISYFWKNDLSERIYPIGEEVAISDHPLDSNIKRKLFIHSMPVLQNENNFLLNIIIRHFTTEEVEGETIETHVTAPYDDTWFSTLVDDSELAGEVGEFTYFKSLVDQGMSIFALQLAQIPQMDAVGRFGASLYA